MVSHRFCVAVLFTVFCGLVSGVAAQKQLTIEDIYENPSLRPQAVSGIQWLPDGDQFTYVKRDTATGRLSIWKMNARNGRSELFVSSDSVAVLREAVRDKRFVLGSYFWSPDNTHILFPAQNDLYLYNTARGKLRQLTHDTAQERDPLFSPDGTHLAYVKKDNLFVLDLATGQEKQLTREGGGTILIGRFDWVYEEEFGIRTGFAWSPDSRAIAYWQLDEQRVPSFPIVDFIPTHNDTRVMKYPKAGDPNSKVRIGVVEIESAVTHWMELGADDDIYIPRIKWTRDPEVLCISRLNRDQNQLELLLANRRTGASRLLLAEKEPAGWIGVSDDLYFLQNRKQFIWTSRRSGWKHAYLGSLSSGALQPITRGKWDLDAIVGVSEQKKRVYFTSTEASSLERHFYGINFSGKRKMELTRRRGTHRISLSPNFKYFIDTYSDAATPWATTLRRINGARVAYIEKNEMPALQEFQLAKVEFLTVPAADGTPLNAFMMKPPDFDSTSNYPVLIYNYSGPGSQIVRNQWGGERYLWHALLTQRGYIVFGVDNRGTGGRGKAFMMATYKNLGDLESQDQIAAAKWLAKQPFVDASRIGIWGWSYGGYISALTFLKAAGLFKVGIAVAPVTDWRNYDTIYTERYMLTPEKNPDGYAKSSCLKYVEKLSGHLLLVHGTADDNVHLANTMQLVYALENARKPFDLMLYPRKLHGIRGADTRVHLFQKLTDYILAYL